ncbi:MAG: biosynthetic arginine decarboxylase [Spirochaetales bacterium]|nr:biosynthetic arginine decarboxylase [Spirochaetales bacterium]
MGLQNKAASDRLNSWTVAKAEELYGVPNWGKGYFSISDKGELSINTQIDDKNVSVSLMEIISGMVERGMNMPVLLRLANLLDAQISKLHNSFNAAIQNSGFKGRFMGVYPIKVNQQHQVIEEITRYGAQYHHGLEAGSKAELMIALSMLKDPEACLICNGYKDEEFIDLALYATQLGLNCFVVLEMISELPMIIRRSRELGIKPQIGVRVKLSAKASGHWSESGGDRSLFGLTISEIIEVIDKLRSEGMLDSLKLLHYHIGSQITNIRDIRTGVGEACQIYAEIALEGANMQYIDLGGGLAVDYDGSKTNFPSSRNYSVREYCEDIIEIVISTLEEKNIPHPHIVTESGRATVAYYSILLFNVLEQCRVHEQPLPEKLEGNDIPEHLQNLFDLFKGLTIKNIQESYNDAIYYKDELYQLFRHGKLSLRDRAKGDRIFWNIILKITQFLKKIKKIPVELEELDTAISDIYYGNFSLFQSLPDIWAIEQLFPIMPIHRHKEEPTSQGIIADITCDCDGKIHKFIDLHDVKHSLPLHDLKPNEEYYLGVFLVGAYQETLGDLHNLLGDTNVLSVRITGQDEFDFVREQEGDSVADVLSYVGYYAKQLSIEFKNKVEQAIKTGRIAVAERRKIINAYENGLRGYTYFER